MKRTFFVYFTALLLVVLFQLDQPQTAHGRHPAAPAAAGEFRFQQSSTSVAENGGAVTITIERINGSDGEVIVGADTFDGTAVAGQDYPATAESLTFADGETEKMIAIPIIDNNTFEPDETFQVVLNIISGPAAVADPDTITITILDNDTTPPGILHFSSDNYAIREDAGFITISVNRSGGAADEVQVSYQTMNGTASAGSDYMPALGTLTFPAGEREQTFTVTLLDDPGAEDFETFTVQLHSVAGVASLGQPATATITLIDDETASFVYMPVITR